MRHYPTIGIFGGSFDPPHCGHLSIINAAIQTLKLQKLFIVPSFLNPFKESFYFEPKMRLEWLKILQQEICLQDCEVLVLDYEVAQQAPTPTYKTLEFIQKTYATAQDSFCLLLGADNVASLHKWANFSWLQKNVEFVVIPRKGCVIPRNFKQLTIKEILISSTQLRKMLESGDYFAASKWIPQSLLESVIKEANCKTNKH